MGALTEATFTALVETGCTSCGQVKLNLRTYVDGRLPLMGGEPVGTISWAYKGETFVDGVFEIVCSACSKVLFHDGRCPRCHAPEGLEKALTAENRWPVPAQCPSCEREEVSYVAMVPARVCYEGKRAEKARTHVELHDPGFHGFRVDCKDCRRVAEQRERCPLCDAPGPIRMRPG